MRYHMERLALGAKEGIWAAGLRKKMYHVEVQTKISTPLKNP